MEKKTDQTNRATWGKSLGSTLRTATLIVSAFFAGHGVANLSAINGNTSSQITLPQEAEEAQPETLTAPIQIIHKPENRPPSDEIRDWYVTKEMTGNRGNKLKVVEHYQIQEIPFLVASELRDANTNEFVQKDTLYNYRYYPEIKESYLSGGRLGYSKHINGFSQLYFAPESAQIKTLLNDGSYDIVDVEYNVNTTLTNTNPQQPEKPKDNTQLHDAVNDAMNSFFEGLYGH